MLMVDFVAGDARSEKNLRKTRRQQKMFPDGTQQDCLASGFRQCERSSSGIKSTCKLLYCCSSISWKTRKWKWLNAEAQDIILACGLNMWTRVRSQNAWIIQRVFNHLDAIDCYLRGQWRPISSPGCFIKTFSSKERLISQRVEPHLLISMR